MSYDGLYLGVAVGLIRASKGFVQGPYKHFATLDLKP